MIVLQRWTASRTSYQTVLIPFITVVLSAWLDNEPIGIGLSTSGQSAPLGSAEGRPPPLGDPWRTT